MKGLNWFADDVRTAGRSGQADLLAIVSHELRTPLTAILGTLTALAGRDRHLTPAERDELLSIANRQGERLKRLIDQLLLASRLEEEAADPVEARPLVEAGELVRQTGRAVQLCHPDRDIVIAVRASPLPVRAAPEAVSQVVTNLLDNAAKYSPEGTPIRLEAASTGGLVVISVTDAGAGVPPGDRDRIFERFAQLDAGATRRAGGIGLGLWIARQLARAHEGELLVAEEAAGGGARFELRLPRAEGVQAPAEAHARGYPRTGSSPVAASR
ncbi:MAG TPA: HAMP domain-containing sensor histidine kinase [Actinomycetes bacterium]|nr:HAMP domain-containing sensor histidine kinase [Actinomycetes bacterium]